MAGTQKTCNFLPIFATMVQMRVNGEIRQILPIITKKN